MKTAMARKNSHFAIVAAPAATPVKPKSPATIATMKKIKAHFSMATKPFQPKLIQPKLMRSHDIVWKGLRGGDDTPPLAEIITDLRT